MDDATIFRTLFWIYIGSILVVYIALLLGKYFDPDYSADDSKTLMGIAFVPIFGTVFAFVALSWVIGPMLCFPCRLIGRFIRNLFPNWMKLW